MCIFNFVTALQQLSLQTVSYYYYFFLSFLYLELALFNVMANATLLHKYNFKMALTRFWEFLTEDAWTLEAKKNKK